MREKILSIKKEMEKQGLSHNRIADMINEDQTKISRMLSGKTKKPDFEVVEKLCGALGMVTDQGVAYASDKPFRVVQEIAPEAKTPTDPITAAIIGVVDALPVEARPEALKALTEILIASSLPEKQ